MTKIFLIKSCSNLNSLLSTVFISVWRKIYQISTYTVFPHIVAAETILFWIFKILQLHIVSASYVMKTWIAYSLGAETIQGWKLFKAGNNMRKYGRCQAYFFTLFSIFPSIRFILWGSYSKYSPKYMIFFQAYIINRYVL